MHADRAGREKNPSTSLRTSQPSTTKLSDSDKLMGTLTHRPHDSGESVDVAIQLCSDGARNSLSVRPASGQAKLVIGDLSRVKKKLRDSREINKRTQRQAGIGEEDGDNGSVSKRQRTEDTNFQHERRPDDANANPIHQPALEMVPQRVVQPGAEPAPQPIAQSLALAPEPAVSTTSGIQSQSATAQALSMAKSVTPFQPEKISELFQYLHRAQLWPLLKLEEQRVQHLLNWYGFLTAPYRTASVAGAGATVPVSVPSSSTTTTTLQPGWPTVIPLAGIASSPTKLAEQDALPNAERVTRSPVPVGQTAQTAQTASGSNFCKINEHLLPHLPNPPLPFYAQNLLDSLRANAQDLMKMPAPTIRQRLSLSSLNSASVNDLTGFIGVLVEIASHGGLPHLAGELDGIVQTLLAIYLTNHRQFAAKRGVASKEERRKTRGDINPVIAYLMRSLPKYPQFARVLGHCFNNLPHAKRSHLNISRKFNYVLELMRDQRSRALPDTEFKIRLDRIVGDVSAQGLSSTSTAISSTASTPTSVPSKLREDDSAEGSDGDI